MVMPRSLVRGIAYRPIRGLIERRGGQDPTKVHSILELESYLITLGVAEADTLTTWDTMWPTMNDPDTGVPYVDAAAWQNQMENQGGILKTAIEAALPVAYIPFLVENVTSAASFSKASNLAADSLYLWFSFIADFNTDAEISSIFDTPGRSEAQRFNDDLRILVRDTLNATLFDYYHEIAAGTAHHFYFEYDGNDGSVALYQDGVDVTPAYTPVAGTVDHTRGSFTLFESTVFNKVGDFAIGTGVPPGISAVYDGGFKDISGLTATHKVTGNAAAWNSNPDGLTSSGTWTDV